MELTRGRVPLGRNRYVELEIRKNHAGTAKPAPFQKPCANMAEAIIMDGGRRGHLVNVCPEPSCRVHHPNTPTPEQFERERIAERKRIERDKLAITIRHRALASILERVSAPLKKADLVTIAEHVISRLPYSQAPLVAKRHRIEIKSGDTAPEQLVKQIAQYNEAGLARFLLELSLLDSAYQRPPEAATSAKKDRLLQTATRYRVDIGKLQKAVAAEMAAKHEKKHGARKTKTA